jgi:hypothetical protein
MKKIILGIIFSLLLVSCDHFYYKKFFMINNCEELINVSITIWNGDVEQFDINAHETYLYYESDGITSPEGIIESSIKEIKIMKGGVESTTNYHDFNEWVYIKGADKFHSECYLYINPEDFEE